MGRVFKNCLEMIKEIDRDLKVCGLTVPVKHYQNKKLVGENQLTKELIGVSFLISKPLVKRKEMLEFIFKEDANRIEKYCMQEHADRTSRRPLNPGNSYKIRKDMWHKFLTNPEKCDICHGNKVILGAERKQETCWSCDGAGEIQKFDYTYAERMSWQLSNAIDALIEDKHTRQALIQVFQANPDSGLYGGNTRIPCSVDYQILIRNNRVHVIYHMRSNDYFGHFPIDIWLAAELLQWFKSNLEPHYPFLKTGSLTYFCGSLHAYKWDIDKWVIY